MKSIIFGVPPWALAIAGGGFECIEVALEGFAAATSFDCGKTPDP